MLCGSVIRILATGTESPLFRTACARAFSRTPFVYSAVNGHLTLFTAEKGEGGEEEEYNPTSVAPSPVQFGSVTDIQSLPVGTIFALPVSQLMHVNRQTSFL